jgi:predicted DNA-binding transcriptional regulator AlpA
LHNLTNTNAAAPAESQRRVLRPSETARLTGYSNMHLTRMEKAGTFPKRFKLNPNGGPHGAAGHDSQEVMDWIDARLASRGAVNAVAE